MYYLLAIALIAAHWHSAIAQTAYPLIGARANGSGYASSCLKDASSIFNNVAGLAGIQDLQAGLTYDVFPGFATFNRLAAVIAAPLKLGTFGGGLFRFGDELYNEQHLTLGYANKFGLASLGGRVSLMQNSTEGFGTNMVITFSVGGIASLTPWLSVGAHIVNVTQPRIAEDQRVPSLLILGVCANASEKVNVMLEVEKDLDYSITVKGGFEYSIHRKVQIRTGVNVHPNAGFFGIGFTQRKYSIDYAASYYELLGLRHQMGVSYHLKKRP